MGASPKPGKKLQWELKYVALPYSSWTQESFDDEREAQQRFEELADQTPLIVNLSMRSQWADAADD